MHIGSISKHRSVRSGRWSLFSLGAKDQGRNDTASENDQRSRNHNRVFGQPVPQDPGHLPPFIFQAFDTLRPHQEEQGIFRISGDADEIKSLKQRIDAGETVDFTTASTPHVVAGVLKLYFRELPEPLLTYDLYDMFIAADSVPDREAQVELICRVLKFLPAGNYNLLHTLCHFLHAVAQHQETNLMPPPNLAIVFAPNLLRPREESTKVVMGDYPMANALMTVMIESCHDIFGPEPPQQPVAPARPKPRLDADTHAKAKRLSIQQHSRQPSLSSSSSSSANDNTTTTTPASPSVPPRPATMRSRHRARNRRVAAKSGSFAKPLPTPSPGDDEKDNDKDASQNKEHQDNNSNNNNNNNNNNNDDKEKPAKPPKPEGGLGKPKRPGTFGSSDLKRASMHRSLRRSVPRAKRKELPDTPPEEDDEKDNDKKEE